MNKKNHFDKITDDSHDVDEDRKDPDGSEQEEDPDGSEEQKDTDGSEEQKDTDGSEEQEKDQKFQDMLFEAMNKIKKKQIWMKLIQMKLNNTGFIHFILQY